MNAKSNNVDKMNGEVTPKEPEKDRSHLNRFTKQAMALPDVRRERVEQIKAKLSAGKYRISPDKIAEYLLEEALTEVSPDDG